MNPVLIVKRLSLSMMVLAASNQVVADEAAIQKKLNQLIPNAAAANIKESVIPNVYEVSLGAKIIYMSGDGQYIINGHIINLDTRENLTEQALNETRKTELGKLSSSSMIVYPAKGPKKRTITVFSDIDCPYCRKLHKEIPALNQAGIEVRYMAYPRAGIGSEAYKKAVSVWCAKDSAKAMDEAMTTGHVTSKTCSNPVRKHMQQAENFGVTGTPNIVFDSGRMIPGYAPANELIKLLTHKAS
ncbi:Thiol:disulfide interchange protein DsbC [Hydrogenovibrio crunogenus]|uniref:Thiol:disulfide interchange protein n=1 Tax=Hydrogenovibrio crunogenus TaxID=39765 RepID=A0A4P7NYF1_9GAMM|nr:DsbC family protein [Hydrogenovibrio crunogenus]QBZ82658.1 Thiol:disulfide interchange protein DsbC [Hydrogenovibrio crunogenus]